MPVDQQITMELSAERATYKIEDGRTGDLYPTTGYAETLVWDTPDPIAIFADSVRPVFSYDKAMTLYSLLISEKGVPKLDVVPCCEKATGRHGLWDMVGQKFYWNVWKDPEGIRPTPDFEYGPDVKNR